MRELIIEKFEEPDEIWSNGGFCYTDSFGRMHRDDDKPAVICGDAAMMWYKHGELHRKNNKPSMILANGNAAWYKGGNYIKSFIGNKFSKK